MFPLGFVIGAFAGATAALVFGAELATRTRPIAKAVLKAGLTAIHEAQVYSAEVAEAAEDLYAEAKSEVTSEIFAAAMAAAQAKAAAQTKAAAQASATPKAQTKTARRRTPVKRSRPIKSAHG